MVNLTRIYTRTGDDGTTALGDMSRALKTDLRLEAFADVDEANSAIGVAIAMGDLDKDVKDLLTRVQNDLFDVGADLATPMDELASSTSAKASSLKSVFKARDISPKAVVPSSPVLV